MWTALLRSTRARLIGYQTLFDETLEIADTPQIGTKTITKANGDVQTIVGDMVEHRRLQMDTRKWMLAKALPKIYGDKLEVASKHHLVDQNDQPLDRLDMARRVAFLLSSGLQAMEQPGQPVLRRH